MEPTSKTDKLGAIDKTLLILETMSDSPLDLTVAELSQLTGINRTTVYRILQDLLAREWVIHDITQKSYVIGPQAFHVGMTYTNHNNMNHKIFEALEKLSERIQEAVGYAIRQGDKVISIYESQMTLPFTLRYHPGQYYPMNIGCNGRCLMAYHDPNRVRELLSLQKFEKLNPGTLTESEEILADYEKIRRQGYVISDGETPYPLIGVGVPTFNPQGEVKGCITCVFFKGPDYELKTQTYLKALKEAADEIKQFLT